MHSQSDLDFPQDRLPSWPHDHSPHVLYDDQGHSLEHTLHTKNLALPWSDNLHSSIINESTAHSTLDAQHDLPPPFDGPSAPNPWPSHPLQWQHLLHHQYTLQDHLDHSHLSSSSLPHLPLLTLPAVYSGPQSASYSSASPISYATADSSPFSFPPSPLPIDPSGGTQFLDSDEQRYVHPAELSAPVVNSSAAATIPDWTDPGSVVLSAPSPHFAAVKHNIEDSSRFAAAPVTRTDRSPARTPASDSTSDIHKTNRASTSTSNSPRRTVRHRGEKRKRTPPKTTSRTARTTASRSNRIGQARVNRQAQTAKGSKSRTKERDDQSKTTKHPRSSKTGDNNNAFDNNKPPEHHDGDDAEDSEEYEDEDDDGSYSTSTSSYSPSDSPPPRYSGNTNTDLIFSANGGTYPHQSRVRRRANGRLPLPVPVPNLIKKSRGRKVPTLPNGNAVMMTMSATTDTNGDSNGSNVDITSLRQRGYMCRVPGCGKCFVRGEHLKRHVRSIHTYEKPHACPHQGCDKTFSRRDNLSQHLRVHR